MMKPIAPESGRSACQACHGLSRETAASRRYATALGDVGSRYEKISRVCAEKGPRPMTRLPPIAAAICAISMASLIHDARGADPLQLVSKIPLGAVSGRIDHMSIDRSRHRLFVAELGNGTVSAVDLEAKAVVKRLSGFAEPQGVLYVPGVDRLIVANGGNGAVQSFSGEDFTPAGKVDLKRDADNLRLDGSGQQVWVGYGSGALAALDLKTLEKKSEIALKDHPEGFQLAGDGILAFVNVPDNREIAVLDRVSGKQTASWKTADARSNFPMTLAKQGTRVIAVFRGPSRLIVFDSATGGMRASVPTCGDSDDVFEDAKRKRLYVSCGAGAIDVFDYAEESPKLILRIGTSSGARTSFFDAVGDRLYLAVRGTPAELWEFAPN